MIINHQSFKSEDLGIYTFTINLELPYGYDQDGKICEGLELKQKRQQGQINGEFHRKNIFIDGTLIGYVSQTKDSNWFAISSCTPSTAQDIKNYGFKNEFYAIRYLHQVAHFYYPECVEEISSLPWEWRW